MAAAAENAKPVLVAVAVIEDRGRYLIGRRPPGAVLAGLWEFPGGKCHSGESAAQAAQRETYEETGLLVRTVGEHDKVTKTYDHGTIEVTFVACRLAEQSQTPRAPFRWVPAAELARFEFPAANAALVQKLVTSASSSSSA
jgi:mutator protein MutT